MMSMELKRISHRGTHSSSEKTNSTQMTFSACFSGVAMEACSSMAQVASKGNTSTEEEELGITMTGSNKTRTLLWHYFKVCFHF